MISHHLANIDISFRNNQAIYVKCAVKEAIKPGVINYHPVRCPVIAYHRACNKSNAVDDNSGPGTA
jgi:hypothetical protein